MTLKLVPRAGWLARPPRYVNKAELSAESTEHWNGPKVTVKGLSTWDHQYCAGLVRGIQNFHMDSRGWSDIAYNFLICPHGWAFEGRGLNVINGANGTTSGNRSSHAVCVLAGQGNPFPDAEKQGFKEIIKYIDANTLAPGTCKGHRDHKSTECPGDERYAWVHAGMPVVGSTPWPTPKPNEEDSVMLRIVTIQGEPTAPGDQPDVGAIYRMLFAKEEGGDRMYPVEGWWHNTMQDVNEDLYVGIKKHPTTLNAAALKQFEIPLHGGTFEQFV